jgi:ribosomal protein L37AE/L43A
MGKRQGRRRRRGVAQVRLIRRDALGRLGCPWCPAGIPWPDAQGCWACSACGASGVVVGAAVAA